MGKKKTGAMPVLQKKKEDSKLVIDMNSLNLKKSYTTVPFKTGKYLTEKDRPRKKNWIKDL